MENHQKLCFDLSNIDYKLVVGLLFAITLTACGGSGIDVEPGDGDIAGALPTSPSGGTVFSLNDSVEYCPVDTYYDELEDACLADCEGLSDEECIDLEDELFGEFDDLFYDSYNSGGNENNAATGLIAKYRVQNDLSLESIENTALDNDDTFNEIWMAATRVLPRSVVLNSITQFHIDSDGESGTLAYVTGDENEPDKWTIAFDDLDYIGPTDKEFIHTTVHEFAHIVFLNDSQLDESSTDVCPNFAIAEGCTYEDSHINRFFQEFWLDIIDESRAAITEDDRLAFYEKYEDEFVSEYSATNPVEDAAEVFTNFVLRDKPETPSTTADEKVMFMHELPALVKLRNDIRGKLARVRNGQ